MQMNVLRRLTILCLAAAITAACGKDYESLEKDRMAIESYFESYFRGIPEDDAVVAREAYEMVDGVYKYVQNFDREGYAEATVAANGDRVEFYYEGYMFSKDLDMYAEDYNPALIFATNRPATLDFLCSPGIMGEAAWVRTLWGDDPVAVTIGNTTIVEGVAIGLEGAREGDRVWMVFTSDLGFGEKELGTVGKNQILAYRIYIEKVTKRESTI